MLQLLSQYAHAKNLFRVLSLSFSTSAPWSEGDEGNGDGFGLEDLPDLDDGEDEDEEDDDEEAVSTTTDVYSSTEMEESSSTVWSTHSKRKNESSESYYDARLAVIKYIDLNSFEMIN